METPVKYTSSEMKTVLIACCAGVFITALMSTMMNMALVHIGTDFSVGSKSLAMVNTSFLLASVIVMVPLARLSDIAGRKKIFVAGLVITIVSALIAAFSPNFEILLLMRLLMGAGSAALSLAGVAMLTDIFPRERRGWAIGVQSTFVYLGIAIGPALGGFICDFLGWRALFFFMIPFAFVALFFILGFKKEIISDKDAKMDCRGSFLYGVTIVLTMYGAINMPEIWAVALVAAGLIMLCVFVAVMKRTKSPVLDLGVFKHKAFSRSCMAAYMNYASSYSVSFFIALYLQSIGALSASHAGLVMLIQPLVQVALTAKFGSYSDKIKDKRILPTAGMAITCAAVLIIIFLGTEMNLIHVLSALILLGLGYAMFAAPNTNTIMSSVPPKNRGEASGMISVVRQAGMMTSMGIAMCCISLIMGTADSINPSTYGQFVGVIKAAFSVCLAMCIAGVIFSWFRGDADEEYAESE
ncbi:MAG: MFS transporter [Candidatus Methanoplasma sp.]|jgi:EmrB/QacA subfamily drug resistance transporter|nr:MFS transporter [Candidatus Methanoplasma sp.]